MECHRLELVVVHYCELVDISLPPNFQIYDVELKLRMCPVVRLVSSLM